jgi:TonB family protein
MTLLAADWNVSPIVEEADASGWTDALGKLDAVPSAGALHLERVLREAAARAGKAGDAAVLFVGHGEDGFAGDAVSGPLADLRAAHIRLSFVATGSGDPPRPLADTAVETGGEVIAARAFDESLTLLVDALQPRPSLPALDAGAGEWHVLRTVTGGAVWIGRALGADAVADAETARADVGSALASDLASLWDRARLEWHDRDAGYEVAQVLTPVTSLLVLETNEDYRRFGLAVPDPITTAQMERRTGRPKEALYGLRGPAENPDPALAGKLAEQRARNAGILESLKAAEEQQALARHIQASENVASIFGRDTALGNDAQDVLGSLSGSQIGQAYGVGGLGLVGSGSSGGGTGEHTIGGGTLGTVGKYGSDGKRAKAPDVIPGQANVRGQLDKDLIGRIIRRHINEVRYCYEQELTKLPGLGGRIMVQFTIAASGQVIASVLQNSTVANARVENCVVQAVRRWEFPKPNGGGIVIVSYPFVLTPKGGASVERAAGPGQQVVAPPIVQALATLTEGSDAAHIERISSLLGMRRTSSAEVLAWTIDRRVSEPFERRQLVARLLEATNHHRDAVRVLTEWARTAPDAIAAELRALKADDDAAEVLALAKRGR